MKIRVENDVVSYKQSAIGETRAFGGSADGVHGDRQNGDGLGAGGEFADEEVQVGRRHEGHPKGPARAQVRKQHVGVVYYLCPTLRTYVYTLTTLVGKVRTVRVLMFIPNGPYVSGKSGTRIIQQGGLRMGWYCCSLAACMYDMILYE